MKAAPSVVSIVLANVLPLFGVVLWGWDVGELFFVYWAENVIVGLYNAAKLALVSSWIGLFLVPFFIIHYGGFCAVHGLFVATFFMKPHNAPGPPFEELVGAALQATWPALLALVASHAIAFWEDVRSGSLEGKTADKQMQDPYPRMIVLHVTIIFGGAAAMFSGQPSFALLLLIALKIGLDLWQRLKAPAVVKSAPVGIEPG